MWCHCKTKIKVFLADDHPVLLEGISLMLEPIPDIEVIGEASNGVELLEKLDQLTLQHALPDVILMDVDMPGLDGYQTTAALKKKYDDLKVLMLTIFDSQLHLSPFSIPMACIRPQNHSPSLIFP